MNRITLLGVPFDGTSEWGAAAAILGCINTFNSLDVPVRPAAVFTPNPLMVTEAQKDEEFRTVLNSAAISLPDGNGIVSASERLGTPLPRRVTGIDTAEKVFTCLAAAAGRVFLLGGKPGVAEKAARNLTSRFPGLIISGTRDGYFRQDETASVVSQIAQSGSDFLVVCLGSPKQERFIHENIGKLRVPVAMGLGGAVDIWAGKIRRAPDFFIRHRIEWLWRMLRQPRRLSAIPKLIKFRILTKRAKKQEK